MRTVQKLTKLTVAFDDVDFKVNPIWFWFVIFISLQFVKIFWNKTGWKFACTSLHRYPQGRDDFHGVVNFKIYNTG